jgi:hypothetical protein
MVTDLVHRKLNYDDWSAISDRARVGCEADKVRSLNTSAVKLFPNDAGVVVSFGARLSGCCSVSKRS